VVAVKAAGVMLVSSFVVIPTATARLVGTSLVRVTWIAFAIGTLGAAIGLIASYHLEVPASSTIVLLHCACFAVALVVSRLRGR
jgi:zinc transport system permease protein